MIKEGKKYQGKAYAFFDCNASREQIEAELPKICHVTKTPAKLEILVFNDTGVFNRSQKEPEIKALASTFKRQYILEAKYPGKSNQETADQIAGVLNQAYQSPLYQDGEDFRGNIVYKHRNKYFSRD
jgi:hypothetical protein